MDNTHASGGAYEIFRSSETNGQRSSEYNTQHRASMEQWRESIRESKKLQSSMSMSGLDGRVSEFRVIVPAEKSDCHSETKRDYKGRIRTWPGILFLLCIVGGAVCGIFFGAREARAGARARTAAYASRVYKKHSGTLVNGIPGSDASDGQIGNPETYATSSCELPNYISKNGKIYSVSKNGTEVAIGLKGLNWFGMETGVGVPLGMWTNDRNGTTAYAIAQFIQENKFNAVRLPVCITTILKNTPPIQGLVNTNLNRAIDISTYMSTLKSIIQTLAYRNIGVLISLHTLTPMASGGTWYDDSLGITKADYLKAVSILTKNLCSASYWNIIGLDAKNEPHKSTWADFAAGAATIGTQMLSGCPSWLVFVEGVNGAHTVTANGSTIAYFDWWGGGLQDAGATPVKLDTPNKLVYAPHYYTPAVSPQAYFYGPGNTELDDATLKSRIKITAYDMFGYLNAKQREAMVLGEFGGLYTNDEHPLKTTKRCTDFLIEVLLEEKYAGGFMWSLNPESAYQYNPGWVAGTFTEGLVLDNWLTPNKVFLKGMAAMDKLPDLKPFPCFPAK
ncbi:cell 5A endo-1,4-betaglucanase [Achlya hypogyna]|uniref:Cell 5A endo-1,4-betaglucanase n=1 Tax=Achlya hypogyna TaxID=1202772 RepID=A0A1V9ZSJ9_ACHHY|nr:cell 5A endo-1,4-betaglucanase [Achlya hypogyna]